MGGEQADKHEEMPAARKRVNPPKDKKKSYRIEKQQGRDGTGFTKIRNAESRKAKSEDGIPRQA